MRVTLRWLILASLLVLALAVGCRPPNPYEKSVVVWTGVTDKERAALIELAAAFKAETGHDVVVQQVPFADLRLKFQVAAPAGLGPDLITGPHDWVGLLATARLIDAISAADLPPAERSALMGPGIEGMTFRNELYGVPLSLESTALIYNPEMLPELPDRFSELLIAAQELTRPEEGKYGLLFAVNDMYFAWPIFSAYGAKLLEPYDQSFRTGIASEAAIKGGNLMQDISLRYKLTFPGVNETFVRQLFTKRKVAAIINGPWALGEIRPSGVPYRIAPLPRLEEGQEMRPLVGITGVMLNRRSKHRPEAVAFMKYLLRTDSLAALSRASGRVPASPEALSRLGDNPDLQAFARATMVGEPMPNHPALGAVWKTAGQALELIGKGNDVRETLQQAAARIDLDILRMME